MSNRKYDLITSVPWFWTTLTASLCSRNSEYMFQLPHNTYYKYSTEHLYIFIKLELLHINEGWTKFSWKALLHKEPLGKNRHLILRDGQWHQFFCLQAKYKHSFIRGLWTKTVTWKCTQFNQVFVIPKYTTLVL